MIDVEGVRLLGGTKPSATLLRSLRRQVGLVFQFHHLFDHLTALRNI
jgi:ABC-type polar amino acid transport system ATPase subunit